MSFGSRHIGQLNLRNLQDWQTLWPFSHILIGPLIAKVRQTRHSTAFMRSSNVKIGTDAIFLLFSKLIFNFLLISFFAPKIDAKKTEVSADFCKFCLLTDFFKNWLFFKMLKKLFQQKSAKTEKRARNSVQCLKVLECASVFLGGKTLTYVMNLGTFCPLEKHWHILTPIVLLSKTTPSRHLHSSVPTPPRKFTIHANNFESQRCQRFYVKSR
jgi:hypothetical protein